MAVLFLAEHAGGALLETTLKALTAAKAIGAEIHVLVAGGGESADAAAAAAARLDGVSKALRVDDPLYDQPMAETYAALLQARAGGYGHVVAAATASGKNILARLAGLLDVMILSDVIEIVDANTFCRPIYAGAAVQTVSSADAVKIVTVRTATYANAEPGGGGGVVETIAGVDTPPQLSTFVSESADKSDRPQLTSARVVVSGGRGVGSKENFALVQRLADRLGAATGASRAAVDSGYAPNDWQVGQTGKVVAPDLYVAIGISGAIQHLAGMKDSKTIVAINKDEEAPIFQVADYGLVADLFEAVPELEEKLPSGG